MDDGSWIWWVVIGAIACVFWPTPEERDMRRQVRNLERIRREREKQMTELSRRPPQSGRGPGDWL
jgi:hypothetical protein